MESSLTTEDNEYRDFEMEIINLRVNEKGVIPERHFPYKILTITKTGERYYARLLNWNERRLRQENLYYELEQDNPEYITVVKITEREYYEALANQMMSE